MATAVKERSTQSRNVTKAHEVRSVTHEEIISLGDTLFQKAIKQQKQFFCQQLSEFECKLTQQLRKERDKELKLLDEQHQERIEQLRIKYLDLQNSALKEEALKVQDIMSKKASIIVEETVLEGQKKLNAALLKARKDFDEEKKRSVKETILKQQNIAIESEIKNQEKHKKAMKVLNKEWEMKMKIQFRTHETQIEEVSEEIKNNMESAFKERLECELNKLNEKHNDEIESIRNETRLVQSEKEKCDEEINVLTENINKLNDNNQKIMKAFQEFVNSSPGFEDGQSDYLLQKLITTNAS